MKVFILITASISIMAVITMLAGKVFLNKQFKKESSLLLSNSKNISAKTFSSRQLEGLPAPVQRYFKYVLRDGQHYISYVNFTHNGQFKTGLNKGWINIKGEHYATTEKPGFIWKGTTTMFTARDMYLTDTGRLVVSLGSLYNVVDVKGETYNQGELLRWLGESILYPTNLLPGERIQWLAIDANHATLTFHYKKLSLYFIVTFNEIGEITQMETKRYMDESKLETWVIKPGNYQKLNGVIIPLSFEVLWRLKEGDFSYARFNIQKIMYDSLVKVQ